VSAAARPVRVLFAGTPDVALPALEALAADPRILLVGALTNPPRPRGRSGAPVDPPVAARARELGLPVLQPERPASAHDDIVALAPDVGAVVAYGALLPASVLALPVAGWVNLHFSLLPRWRGAAPVQHAIRAGDAVTGVSVFRLEAGMDTGAVLRRTTVPLRSDADAGTVLAELAALGAPLLLEGALAAAAGEPGAPQDDEGVTLAPRLGPDAGRIDWSSDAPEVVRAILAVTPRPGASTRRRGRTLKLADPALDVTPIPQGTVPGTVLGHAGDGEGAGVVIACGRGAVRIGRLQPEGRRWAAATEVLRGRGVAVGDVLGDAPGARSDAGSDAGSGTSA
jgi:methionyl-tRNA formyltransferase